VIKKIARKLLQKFGLEVHRIRPTQKKDPLLAASLKQFNIDLVLDVGANIGQFASFLRNNGYTGRIVSFEPLSEAYAELKKSSSQDPLWEIGSRCALGNFDGEAEINISGNSWSSSLLPMLKTHEAAAPSSVYKGTETVSLRKLDSVSFDLLVEAGAPFLKIDTQGFEWSVLDGARETIPKLKGIMVELSLVPLYEGQHLWGAIIDRLEREGFTLWSLQPAFTDRASGRILQLDGVFYRNP